MIATQDRRLVAAVVGCMSALALVCCLVLPATMLFLQTKAVSNNTVVEMHQMKWANEPYGRCDTYVVLEFETAPGYVISACSKELLQSLETSGTNPVSVRFTRTAEPHFLITTWHYQIEQVGNWTGTADFFGLALRCSYKAGEDPATSPCGKTRPPIREPYTIK